MQAAIERDFAAGDLPGLHSVLIQRGDDILAEAHFAGEDWRWGKALGKRAHGPDVLHDMRSVTKTIVSLLYGIARAESLVPDVETPLLAAFPEYPDLAADPARQSILIRHVLSMKTGMEWNEDLPYSDPKNSEVAMEMAADRYRFALSQPMVTEPGDWWDYNGGATALIARLIEKGAGQPIDAFADTRLFAPLGIRDWDWIKGADGVPSAASGLRLNAHDLAKIGRLVLDDGRSAGTQIVPADWLEASLAPRAKLRDGPRYGYFWWLAGEGDPPHWVAGFGNGGQRLWLHPKSGTVMVVFAGRYNDREAWKVSVSIIENHIVPTL